MEKKEERVMPEQIQKCVVNTAIRDVNIDAEWGKIISKDSFLLYEGYMFHGKPCGTGTSYHHNGNKYQEGWFGIKGLLSGKEYYPNGSLRFEGEFRLNKAYGPNAPVSGSFYDVDGNLMYHGDFRIRTGGVGFPMILVPMGYGPIVQAERPADLHYLMWEDIKTDS